MAEVIVDHPDLPLTPTIRDVSGLTVSLDSQPLTDAESSGLFYSVTDSGFQGFESALERDHTVEDWALTMDFADCRIYRVRPSSVAKYTVPKAANLGVRVLSIRNDGRQWRFQLQAPDKEGHDACGNLSSSVLRYRPRRTGYSLSFTGFPGVGDGSTPPVHLLRVRSPRRERRRGFGFRGLITANSDRRGDGDVQTPGRRKSRRRIREAPAVSKYVRRCGVIPGCFARGGRFVLTRLVARDARKCTDRRYHIASGSPERVRLRLRSARRVVLDHDEVVEESHPDDADEHPANEEHCDGPEQRTVGLTSGRVPVDSHRGQRGNRGHGQQTISSLVPEIPPERSDRS